MLTPALLVFLLFYAQISKSGRAGPQTNLRTNFHQFLVCFPKAVQLPPNMGQIQELYFISQRKSLKIRSCWWAENRQATKIRRKDMGYWFSGSLQFSSGNKVSVGGWSPDILKSQKKGILRSFCKEGFVNSCLSGFASACIISLFIWFYRYTWASSIPAPPPHPIIPGQDLLSIPNKLLLPRRKGGWGQKKRLHWPGIYPKKTPEYAQS